MTERAKLYLLPITTLIVLASLACGESIASPPAGNVLTPVYNQESGRLEQLTSDRDKDGKIDTWAYLKGAELERVEIDRDADGTFDRVEYYNTLSADAPGKSALERAVIVRAEELSGDPRIVTRREFHDRGELRRAEEDTNSDGRMDRWDMYEGGALVRMDLDSQGAGFPTRRLIYGRGGVQRVEVDPDGNGVFTALPAKGTNP